MGKTDRKLRSRQSGLVHSDLQIVKTSTQTADNTGNILNKASNECTFFDRSDVNAGRNAAVRGSGDGEGLEAGKLFVS